MCALPEVRHQAGCKDPTHLYTTNSSESMNHIIKWEVKWKERQLPDLIESPKSIANDQISQLEKALISWGEWHLTPQYKNLIVTESCWFSKMSDTAKKVKVFTQNPTSAKRLVLTVTVHVLQLHKSFHHLQKAVVNTHPVYSLSLVSLWKSVESQKWLSWH